MWRHLLSLTCQKVEEKRNQIHITTERWACADRTPYGWGIYNDPSAASPIQQQLTSFQATGQPAGQHDEAPVGQHGEQPGSHHTQQAETSEQSAGQQLVSQDAQKAARQQPACRSIFCFSFI